MTTEEKIMVRQLHAKAQYALVNSMPLDTPDNIMEAVWARLIVSLGNDLVNWSMSQEV